MAPEASVADLTVRVAKSADYAALRACMADVFRETGGQKTGEFDQALWEWQYLHPERGSLVVIAAVGGVICGYYHALLFDMRRRERAALGAIVQDVGTLRQYRRLGVFRAMGGFALDELRARGIDFIYTFPNARSLPSFVRNHSYTVVGRVPVYCVPLDLGPVLAGTLRLRRPGAVFGRLLSRAYTRLLRPQSVASEETVTRLDAADESLVPSIEEFAGVRRIGLQRTPAYLRWRFAGKPDGGYSVWCLRRRDEVRGYVVTRTATLFGTRCLVLMDLGCRKGDEPALLTLIGARLADERERGAALGVVMGLHPFFSRLSRLGFVRVWERFNPRPFHLLARDLRGDGADVFDPTAWHITLADWDVF